MIKKYWSLIEFGYKQSVAYKADFIVGLFSTFFKMIILAFIWKAVFAGARTDLIRGRTLNQTITYVILAQALWSFLNNNIEVLMGYKIRHGEVASDLLKPVGFPLNTVLNNLGFTSFIFIVQTMPAFILVSILYSIAMPSSLVNLVFALVSIILAYIILVSISFTVGILGFWTQNLWGLGLLKQLLISFFSGSLVPLYLYPESLQKIVYRLPFKEIINTPISIYQGTYEGSLVRLMMGQVIWAAVFVGIGQLFWYYLKRKIVIFGG